MGGVMPAALLSLLVLLSPSGASAVLVIILPGLLSIGFSFQIYQNLMERYETVFAFLEILLKVLSKENARFACVFPKKESKGNGYYRERTKYIP